MLAESPPGQFRESSILHEILRSWSLFRFAKDAEAESTLQAAAAQAHAIGAWDLEADADILLGSRLLGPANLDRAEAALREGLQVAADRHLEYRQMAALLNLGVIHYKRGLYGDAIPYFERAIGLAHRLGANEAHRVAIQDAASCYREIGDVDPALKTQLEVVKDEEKHGLPTTRSNAYIDLGTTYLLKQDTSRAIQCFRKAVECVTASEVPAQFVLSASNLAQALELAGALDEAERYNEEAFRVCNRKNKEHVAELTLNKAALAEHRGQHERAITAYREAIETASDAPSLLWEAHAGLGSVYARMGDVAQAHAHFEQGLRVIEQNRSRLRTEYQITFLSSLIRFYQEYVSLLMSEGEVEKALEVADSSRASVLAQSLPESTAREPNRLVGEVQRMATRGNIVFLFYWLAPQRSYLWVIMAHDVRAIPLPGERQIAQDVNSYRSLLLDEKRDALSPASGVGERLYQMLIDPAETLIPHGGRVVIVPDGVLHNLNFEMLVSSKPQPHYWIEDVLVSVAPSLGILRDGKGTRETERSLLLIGDTEPAAYYAKLPQAAQEIDNVRQYFPSSQTSVYRGARATVDAYRAAAPRKFSTLHFATHAEANEQSPLDSAIILSPAQNGYKLYARDVMEIPLTADLVTISACRGAGARTLSGEGPVGLAWAFFQAGARNVVTSIWEANDRSTADLMNKFYNGVESGKPYVAALHEAKLGILGSYRRPYYWAPFQLYTRVVSPD